MSFMVYEYANQLYMDWYYYELMKSKVELDASISVSPNEGVTVIIENETDWITIAKLITTLLSTYLGVKVINKFVQ